MAAVLKIYTDAAHTLEVPHTSNIITTLSNSGSTLALGATSLPLASVTGMPASGYVDIDTAGNLETLEYISISGNTLNLATATTINHTDGVAVVQWYYLLAIGDQSNGLLNDGSNSTPVAGNTATWYLYNAGSTAATSLTIATSNTSPSTVDGYADTLVSITSSSSGFAASQAISSFAAGAVQQFWIVAEVPAGQAISGSANPQLCLINFSFL